MSELPLKHKFEAHPECYMCGKSWWEHQPEYDGAGIEPMSSPVQPLTPAQTALQEAQTAKEGYLRRLPVALDIFASEIEGNPMGMTISTSWGLLALGRNPSNPTQKVNKFRQALGKLGCKALNLVQKNHDAGAAAGDDYRAAHLQQLLKVSGIIS